MKEDQEQNATPKNNARNPGTLKTRGASFPVLSLPEAIKIVRDAGAYGKVMTPAALAAYAGHQSATSGPWKQKAAALREWGLIESLSADKIGLTARALQIAHPESQEKVQEAMLQSFNSSQLYTEIYEDLAKGVELQLSALGNKAVTSHGISIASKDKFVNSFIESAAAVNLAERVGTDKVKILGHQIDTGTQETVVGQSTETVTPAPQAPVRQGGLHAMPIVNQVWEFDGGEILLSINADKPLQAQSYGEISKVVSSLESLVQHLGEKVESLDSEDAAL